MVTFTSVASAKSFLNSQSTSSDRIVNNSGDTITLIPVARPTEVRNNNNDTLLNMGAGSWIFIKENNNVFDIYNYSSSYQAQLLINYTGTFSENGNDYNYVEIMKNMKLQISILMHIEILTLSSHLVITSTAEDSESLRTSDKVYIDEKQLFQ